MSVKYLFAVLALGVASCVASELVSPKSSAANTNTGLGIYDGKKTTIQKHPYVVGLSEGGGEWGGRAGRCGLGGAAPRLRVKFGNTAQQKQLRPFGNTALATPTVTVIASTPYRLGAQRRKLTKDSELAHSALLSKVLKLTKFFTIAEGTTQQPTSSLLATSNTQDFDHECEQDLILTEVEETAEILKEETNDKLRKGTVEMLNYRNKKFQMTRQLGLKI
ncbi:hypothetical protein J6590_069306 [Homalodisca vitripennis]|nr:hypothetical protein J6590_069306 [Homalodisca vitripennis]